MRNVVIPKGQLALLSILAAKCRFENQVIAKNMFCRHSCANMQMLASSRPVVFLSTNFFLLSCGLVADNNESCSSICIFFKY